MCLAIPMQVSAVNGLNARCSAWGIEREVSLFLLQDEAVAPGDYLLIHVGYAIQKIDAEQAKESLELFNQAAGLKRPDDGTDVSAGSGEHADLIPSLPG